MKGRLERSQISIKHGAWSGYLPAVVELKLKTRIAKRSVLLILFVLEAAPAEDSCAVRSLLVSKLRCA